MLSGPAVVELPATTIVVRRANAVRTSTTTSSSSDGGDGDCRRVDLVTLEVVRNRLEAIVEEMGVTMLKSAHSPIFYESKDYSVALFSPAGELLAMGQYIPHHQGGMYAALIAVSTSIRGETMDEATST